MAYDRLGYCVSPNAAVNLTTDWDPNATTPIRLAYVAADPMSSALPNGALLGSVDLDLDTPAGGVTTIQGMLTWDAAATKVIAGPTDAATIWAGAGIPAGRSGISFALADRPALPPTGQTIGECYLWLRTNVGTINVSALGARLNFRIPAG